MRLNFLRPQRPPPPPKIHAFVAVHYDDEFLDEVAALAERLRGDPRLSAATWSRPRDLRTTIHFFLDTTEAKRARLPALVEELAAMASSAAPPALVRASRLHGFPSPESASFVVLDVEDVGPVPCLSALQARAEAESVALGYEASTRVAAPFFKLARIGTPVDVSGLADQARTLAPGRLSAISLYVSSAIQNGDVHNRYDRVATAPLRAM